MIFDTGGIPVVAEISDIASVLLQLNLFSASCSKLLLFERFSATLV